MAAFFRISSYISLILAAYRISKGMELIDDDPQRAIFNVLVAIAAVMLVGVCQMFALEETRKP